MSVYWSYAMLVILWSMIEEEHQGCKSNATLNMKHKIRCQPQYREIDRPLNLRLRQPGPIYLQMVGCPAAGVGTAVGVKVGAAVGGCAHTLRDHDFCVVVDQVSQLVLLAPPI